MKMSSSSLNERNVISIVASGANLTIKRGRSIDPLEIAPLETSRLLKHRAARRDNGVSIFFRFLGAMHLGPIRIRRLAVYLRFFLSDSLVKTLGSMLPASRPKMRHYLARAVILKTRRHKLPL